VRSAEKAVSPLSWFTSLSCPEVEDYLHVYFTRELDAREVPLSQEELDQARRLVESKYASPAWINRLP